MSTHLSPTRPRALAAALLLACAAIPLLPLLGANGWPHCHEGARYFFLAESFKTVFDAGVLYPRWLPDLAGGYGYPTFVFYQPAFFFLTLPFFALFESTLMGMGAVIATLTFAGALGMYRLSRILAGRGVSLLSSALFMLSPYVFVNVYVRGDLSEFMAMMLAPWTLFFALRLRTTTQDRTFRRCGLTFGLALSLVGVVTSHPVIAMFCFPLAFAFALWLLIAEKGARMPFCVDICAGFGLGLLLSSPYWLTVFQMQGIVEIERAFTPYYWPTGHTVEPWQLFSRAWNFLGSFTTPQEEMPMQLGLAHAVFALSGLILGWRNKVLWFVFSTYLILVLLMLPFSIPFWELPLIKKTQFPWRLLSLISVLQAFCVIGVHTLFKQKAAEKNKGALLRGALVAGLLALTALWCAPQFQLSPEPGVVPATMALLEKERRAMLNHFETFSAMHEFLPKTAHPEKLQGGRQDAMVLVNAPHQAAPLPENSPMRISYRITVQQPAILLINQFYFPGWSVSIDGAPIPDDALKKNLTPDGRMLAPLSPGEHVFLAYYEGPPGWRVRNAAILVGALCFCALYVAISIRRPRSSE